MVGLSQDQKLTQSQTPNIPSSDQPPMDQPPIEPPKQSDEPSFPPMKDGEKPVTPKQEEIKKELSELGIPPRGGSKKTRLILATLGVLFLIISLPVAIYLVKQRQEIRKIAYKGQTCDTDAECSDYPYEECVDGICQSVSPPATPTPPPGACPNPCSGTLSCPDPSTQKCVRVSDTCSECRPRNPGIPPGCCETDNDCAHWEVCSGGNTACPSNKSCRSTEGCVYDSDCLPPRQCIGGWCSMPGGGIECRADENGVSVVNNTTGPISGTVSWFASRCDDPACLCGGAPSSTSISLNQGQSWSASTTGGGCAWQTDVTYSGSGGGCHNADSGCSGDCNGEPTPTPTPSPPPGCYGQCSNDQECPSDLVCQEVNKVKRCVNADCSTENDCLCEARCEYCKVFDEDWNEITDLSTIGINQVVRFVTFGSTSHAQGITKARFRINGGDWIETTDRHQNMFYIQYVITEAGSYTVESMVYNPGLGWY